MTAPNGSYVQSGRLGPAGEGIEAIAIAEKWPIEVRRTIQAGFARVD